MAVFKARARALDMLGRQQIAGIPTAISELFKNAHDAYADRIEVDFFRENGLFILRDDGLGMTEEDFEKRWLTLGTESKLGAGVGLPSPPIDPDKPHRPIMGEKGIGRLAIAVIGSQVLILTRAKRPEGLSNLVVAFIHWGMFELPGIDLDQIEIPLRLFPGGTIPSRSEIQSLVDGVRTNIRKLKGSVVATRAEEILAELDQFDVDPRRYDGRLLGPHLNGDGHGTHFYILPASEYVAVNLDEEDANVSRMSKTLLGFTNTMSVSRPVPPIRPAFRDYKNREIYSDIFESRDFFVPEDFENADHYIVGKFDDRGQFTGTVSVFGQEYTDHIVGWKGAVGDKTECGPFGIEIGYVMGKANESTLPPDDFARMSNKLDRYGGLYIYRDNIRILPYGDTDVDWINMEKNRSKNAAYYFFSYRRIFGLVTICQADNPSLIEKAGREGFRENKAYRQFRSIIQNFFLQIAADFFRASGSHSGVFTERKSEAKRKAANEKRERERLAAHTSLERQLSRAFVKLEEQTPQREVAQILTDTTAALENLVLSENRDHLASDIATLEGAARQKIREIQKKYEVNEPIGVGLLPDLRRQMDLYTSEYERLNAQVFQPALAEVTRVTGEVAVLGEVVLNQRDRLLEAVDNTSVVVRRDVESVSLAVRNELSALIMRVEDALSKTQSDVDKVVESTFEHTRQMDTKDISDNDFAEQHFLVEEPIVQAGQRAQEAMSNLLEQLKSMRWDHEGSITSLQSAAVIEEELLVLKSQTEADLELIQLGMAIDVINHEFNNTIESVRVALRRMKAWADMNERLDVVYQELRASFDHLDGYLALFTPIHRRLYRNPIEFTGKNIATYLYDIFRKRLLRLEIILEVTPAFENTRIIGFPSTFYPVFVNLVDNAIFWLQDKRSERVIRLDTEGEDLLVSDTGPGVPLRDREAIFEQGFSRKPGGRGLGLYISHDVLRRAGYDLSLDSEGNQGATFRIRPAPNSI